MRRLLRLALPLGLLAALVIPAGAFAQVTVSTNQGGGLALLASSPTDRDSVAFTGNTTNLSSTVTGINIDVRALSFGDVISGPGIPGGTQALAASPGGAIRSGGTIASAATNIAAGPRTVAAAPNGAVELGNTVTMTTTTAHGLVVGDSVVIAGVAVGGYNGTYTVVSVPSTTTFTYTNPTAGLAASGGGTVTGPNVGAIEVGNTVTIITTAAHNYAVGDTVTIAGVGVAGYNGTFVVATVPTATSFTYTNPTAGLAASGGGTSTIRGAIESGNTVTIRLTADHNLQVGQPITISGVGVAGYNGSFTVASVVSSTTFTYNNPLAGLGVSGGGTVAVAATYTTTSPHGLSVGSNVTIAGVGVAGYNGTFTVASVPTATTFTTTSTAGLAPSGGGTVSTATTVTAIGDVSASAILDPFGLNNSILWTAVNPGLGGNALSVAYNDPGGDAATLGATVVGPAITINLGRSDVGAAAAVDIQASPTGATESGNTVTITTTGAHGLTIGRTVTIAGVGDPGYNGTFTVASAPTTNSFTYTNPTAGLPASGGGTMTGGSIGGTGASGSIAVAPGGATESGTTVTITTTAPHSLAAGQSVVIAGVAVGGYNGTFTVTAAPTATTFTYTAATPGLANSGGGTFTGNSAAAFQTSATIAASPTGATEVGNFVTITTTAAHNLSVGSSVTISGVGVAGYNGTFIIDTVPTATTFTYTNTGSAGLAASGGGSVLRTTITTTAAHGLQIGQNVNISGVAVAGYNGPATVTGIPTTTTFNFTTGSGLASSGGGSVYTVTTTGTALIAAVNAGNGDFAAVLALANASASGTVTGRLAGLGATSLIGGASGDVASLSQPASATGAGVSLSASKGQRNTDLAFWGDTLVQGNNHGLRIFDISDPSNPDLLSDYACNGAYGDVSIWGNLVFRSIDVPQTTASCAGSLDEWWTTTGGNHTASAQTTNIDAGFEGIRIIDISNPSSPVFVKGVATDCGSFTHTIVPDLGHDPARVLLYVSSFPNSALSGTATPFGNTCEQSGGGHDKISIIEVPIANPSSASKIAEIPLGLKGYNSYFSYIPGYTGDFNNTPGYKGCHDIAVSMPTKTAAAACVTEGITLDITDPEAPTVKDHFVNPYTDLCATGVYRWTTAQGTTATTPNCMWNSATFTYDGKHVIWGEMSSGTGGCNSNATGSAQSCNDGGNTNAGVDRFFDGTSVTNECDLGGGGANRDPLVRGAFWMFALDDPSFPIASFKTPRFERYSNQGCTAHLMNVVPVNGSYVVPMSWQLGGVDVVDWTNSLNPLELAWFDVDTTAPEAVNANGTNRDAGDSALRSNAWAAYWYNGHVYASYDSPVYGSFNPAGSRGLEVFNFDDASVAGAFDLPHLNPQTQEDLISCTVSAKAQLKVGVKSTVKVTVKALGQGVLGASVKAKTYGYSATKTTNASGQVSFTYKPQKAKPLTITVAAEPNMIGCKTTKQTKKR